MLKFFRAIRQRLLSDNKFSKYFLYAIGEIILVVIGILIALQINTWNSARINQKKEINYLQEIRLNLVSDTLKIKDVIAFNILKEKAIIDCIEELANPNAAMNRVRAIGQRMNILGSYEIFKPNNLGFQNLMSAQQLDLISNDSLRKMLLDFYSFDFSDNTQQRIMDVTRNFVDYTLPKIAVKEHFNSLYNVSLELQSVHDVKIYNDPYIISNLDLMIAVMEHQSEFITEKKNTIELIIQRIDSALND